MSRRSAFLVFAFILAVLFSGRTKAQHWYWDKIGTDPYNSWSVYSADFDDSGRVYVCDHQTGVHRSTDEGKRWEPCNYGLEWRSVYDVLPTRGDTVFAATDSGLFRSVDAARSWFALPSTQSWGAVFDLKRSGQFEILAACAEGAFASDDAGRSWRIFSPLPQAYVYELFVTKAGSIFLLTGKSLLRFIDKSSTGSVSLNGGVNAFRAPCQDQSGNLYTVTIYGLLYCSSDDGLTWTSWNTGFNYTTGVAASLDGQLFLGTEHNGVLSSRDGGHSWSPLARQFPGVYQPYFSCMQVDPKNRLLVGNYYGGLYRVPADSSAWQLMRGGILPSDARLASDLSVSDEGVLVVSDWFDDFWRSTDEGNSWVRTDAGVRSWSPFRIVGGSKNRFAALSSDSVYFSNDAAATWTSHPSPGGRPNTLAINTDGVLFLGAARGVFRSDDEGVTWTDISASVGSPSVRSLAIDTLGAVYALTDAKFILASTDNGASWSVKPATGLPASISGLTCGTGGFLLAFAFGNTDVYVSTDGGGTFRTSATGVERDGISTAVIDRKNRIYAGARYGWDGGIRVSSDFGATWHSENGGLYGDRSYTVENGHETQLGTISFAVASNGRVYVLTDSGLFRSADWTLVHNSTLSSDQRGIARHDIGHNYPNPFRPATTVAFTLARRGHADVRVFDCLGREVALLADGIMNAGPAQRSFNGSGLPGGVYFCRITTGDGVQTLRMLLQP